jgi:Glycosyl transferase family 2
MKLHAFTIALDGMPYLRQHLSVLEASGLDFTWHIVHGAANNSGSTKWCKRQQPRLSRDGSAEYINSLEPHPNVRLYQQQWWEGGKDEMVNAPLAEIKEQCVLMEIDADEIWKPEQLQKIVHLFETEKYLMRMQFYCRYFVGPNLIVEGDSAYGNQDYEWYRAWLFQPGQKFTSHEPPVLDGFTDKVGTRGRAVTKEDGLVFDHMAYALEHQVAYKEHFYGYDGALANWRRLQTNQQWPVEINKFLPWAKTGTVHKI